MTPGSHKIKRALISVSDKSGIAEFAKELAALGVEIFSTGGTAKLLKESGIDVKTVDSITGFPEILDGRVKTLHPAVHAGLLADLGKESHRQQMDEHGLNSIDLLVINLYPFEETLRKEAPHYKMIENIDIGGPAMLRAAAKNYKWTAVLVDPSRYNEILEKLKSSDTTLDESYRSELAGEAFALTSYYDSLIAGYFRKHNETDYITGKTGIPLKLEYRLRYGENPHQSAALFGEFSEIFQKLHGKELSFNNIIDISAAANIINEFRGEGPACAIIKHTNPCGVATGSTLSEAYCKAFETDKVSPFGGIISFNGEVDIETAKAVHDIFTEVIIAPSFTDEALELLTSKKNRRLIAADLKRLSEKDIYDLRSVPGGWLMQESDKILYNDADLKVVSKRKPTAYEMQGLLFAWKVCKHVKSNAIVYTASDRTLAIGAGQMSRVDSSMIAVSKAKEMGLGLKNSCLASDAFFPFPDGLIAAAEAGATAVIQPGGSVRDEEVIKAADERNLAMVFTGMRHFRH